MPLFKFSASVYEYLELTIEESSALSYPITPASGSTDFTFTVVEEEILDIEIDVEQDFVFTVGLEADEPLLDIIADTGDIQATLVIEEGSVSITPTITIDAVDYLTGERFKFDCIFEAEFQPGIEISPDAFTFDLGLEATVEPGIEISPDDFTFTFSLQPGVEIKVEIQKLTEVIYALRHFPNVSVLNKYALPIIYREFESNYSLQGIVSNELESPYILSDELNKELESIYSLLVGQEVESPYHLLKEIVGKWTQGKYTLRWVVGKELESKFSLRHIVSQDDECVYYLADSITNELEANYFLLSYTRIDGELNVIYSLSKEEFEFLSENEITVWKV